MNPKHHWGSVLVMVGVGMCFVNSQTALAQNTGKDIFQQRCMACHSIGEGRRVGPDLAGVNDRRTEDWLIPFIKSPQTVAKSGDQTATKLFEEFNGIVMPDQALSNNEIKGVLSFIRETTPATKQKNTDPSQTQFSPEDIQQGQNFFQGNSHFSNGGPACISCHDVKNDAVIGGGVLAKDLTLVFSRMGDAGVSAILGSPPFPVMETAYKNKPLTPEETRALIAFFQHADQEHSFQKPRDYGLRLFNGGLGGALGLLAFYVIVGRRRKKCSINQSIYDRQIKSKVI